MPERVDGPNYFTDLFIEHYKWEPQHLRGTVEDSTQEFGGKGAPELLAQHDAAMFLCANHSYHLGRL